MEDDWVLMNDDCLKELEANVKDNNEPPGMFLILRIKYIEQSPLWRRCVDEHWGEIHAFFIRNDKKVSSTRSFLNFTPFLVPKIS